MDGSESERVIITEISTEYIESKTIHKSINKNEVKYAIDEKRDEETLVIHNPVINKPIYFNLFECGKNYWKMLMPRVN